jgi:hypothetical protein
MADETAVTMFQRMLALWLLLCAGMVCEVIAQQHGSAYAEITNLGPAPAGFRPFRADSIWNTRLPDDPANVDAVNSALVKIYAENTGGSMFWTAANNAITGCVSPCGGMHQASPLYVATTSDPAVTINCANAGYGCAIDTLYSTVSSIPGTFYIPANARSSSVTAGYDSALAVLQPDGTELDIYGCKMTRDWRNGDIVGTLDSNFQTGCPVAGVAIANVVTGYGYNNTAASGYAHTASVVRYNEFIPMGATITHALNVFASCPSGYVYPGSDLGPSPCAETGLPTGVLIHLNLSHAEIDAKIALSELDPYMKPFYYALHDYGAYFLDAGNCAGGIRCFLEDVPIHQEDAQPWIRNGQTNPWIPWFDAQSSVEHWTLPDSGTPVVSIRVEFWGPIADDVQVLSSCYAMQNCSDSIQVAQPPVFLRMK